MALRDRLNKRRAKRDESLSAPILTQEQKNAQSEALGAQQEAQMGDNLKQAKVVDTPITTPAPQETQGEVIETPKEGNVLTPEQTAAARDRMRAEVAEQLAQSGKENLQRLNLSQIQKMTSEASERGRKDIEERENKKRRREALFGALGDGIAAMANLYFTSKGAPNVKYKSTLSEAQQARWDKIDAQRKAEEEQAYLRYQNDLKRQIDERKAQQEAERDRKDDEYRDKSLAQQEQYRQDQLALQKYNAELNAQVRREQFQEQTEREAAKQDAITYRTLYKRGSGSSGVTPLYIGNGEVIDISSKALSEQKNVSAVYNALPEAYKKAAFEKFNLGKYNEKKQLTPTQMNQIIGEYIEMDGAEAAREILRNLAGSQPSTGSKQVGLGWGISNESDSNEVDW